jgi:hypothetical protein
VTILCYRACKPVALSIMGMSLANAVLQLLAYCPPFRDLFRDLGRLVGHPWPEYRHAQRGRRQMFRQSTLYSILSIEMPVIEYEGTERVFEVVVRCATMFDQGFGFWRNVLGERRA